jgi:hypothetical protein
VAIPFRDRFDRLLAEQGPPALFTVDAGGELRVDLVRTRDGWSRLVADVVLPREVCHCLYRDRATGFVQYVLVTAPELYSEHPRADVRRYDSQADALAALAAIGRPPIADRWL